MGIKWIAMHSIVTISTWILPALLKALTVYELAMSFHSLRLNFVTNVLKNSSYVITKH
jgi:hypothetical protein